MGAIGGGRERAMIFTMPMPVESAVSGRKHGAKREMSAGPRRAPAGLPLGTFLRCPLRFPFIVLWNCGAVGCREPRRSSALLSGGWERHATAMWWAACIHAGPTHKTGQLCFTSFQTHRQALLRVSFPLLQRPFTALVCKSGTCTATQSWRQAVT